MAWGKKKLSRKSSYNWDDIFIQPLIGKNKVISAGFMYCLKDVPESSVVKKSYVIKNDSSVNLFWSITIFWWPLNTKILAPSNFYHWT